MDIKIDTKHEESLPSESKPTYESPSDHDHEAELEPHIHFKTILVEFAVCCIYFAQVVNVVGAGAYSRDIEAVLGASDSIVWLTSSSTILTVVFGLPACEAADYWGRKWFLVILTACGFVGCLILSRATSMGMAIAGEVVAGLSYGAQPLIHAVSSEILPRKWRPHAQAALNVAVAGAGLAGLLIGGSLTETDPNGFRTYWYITAALYGVSAIICALFYNPPRRELQDCFTMSQKFGKLDWMGYALLSSGLVLFCMALSWSQNPYSWTDAHVLAAFLIGVALSVGLIIYETVFKKDGLIHHDLFSRGRNFPIALGCIFVEGLSFFAANNYFAFENSVFWETDNFKVSVKASIIFIVYIVSSTAAGVYCTATKRVRLPSIVAFVTIEIFFILMATSTPSAASGQHAWGYPVFLGIGLGLCLCSLVTAGQFSSPPALISTASGLMLAMRALGASFGLCIYNAIFNYELSANLAPKITAATLPMGLPETSLGPLISALAAGNAAAAAMVPGVTPAIIGSAVGALHDAFALGFRYVWVAAGCFTFAALVASIFLIDPTSDFNSHIDAPAETEEELFGSKQIS